MLGYSIDDPHPFGRVSVRNDPSSEGYVDLSRRWRVAVIHTDLISLLSLSSSVLPPSTPVLKFFRLSVHVCVGVCQEATSL